MVAGRLQEKNGNFYIVLELKDQNGKRKPKWISTGLKVRGNKRKAEEMLQQIRKQYSEIYCSISADMFFTDFIQKWLAIVKPKLAKTTYASYASIVKTKIVPYFDARKTLLQELTASDLNEFYSKQSEIVSQRTVMHYHSVIHEALTYAVKHHFIRINPATEVERPKAEKYNASFYSEEEITMLFEAAKGDILEKPILFGSFYGLRRSEIVGLRWPAFDFKKDSFIVKHTVTSCYLDGKRELIARDATKTKESERSYPLVPIIKKRLLELREEQEKYMRLCGNSYNTEYKDYLCVHKNGDLIKPDYITDTFPRFLEKNGLRRIRFHDLRHSSASLLVANGVAMKDIQEWMGHSDFSTTANIYAHLEYTSKITSAKVMETGLSNALAVLS